MSFGKMNTFIDIISTVPVKDSEGFAVTGDTILASIRAYKEDRRGMYLEVLAKKVISGG